MYPVGTWLADGEFRLIWPLSPSNDTSHNKDFVSFSLLSDYTIFQIFSFILPLNCSLLDSMEIVRVSRQHNLAPLKFCKRQNTFIYFLLCQMYISNFLLNLGSFPDFEFYDLFSSYKFVKIVPDWKYGPSVILWNGQYRSILAFCFEIIAKFIIYLFYARAIYDLIKELYIYIYTHIDNIIKLV